MTLYLDTSALVKLFVNEADSPKTRALSDRATLIVTSVLTYLEAHSALARRVREKSLTVDLAQLATDQLDDRWTKYSPIPVTTELIRSAATLVTRYPLRAYDALHLASAFDAQRRLNRSITFAAFDQVLNRAAKREGLVVI